MPTNETYASAISVGSNSSWCGPLALTRWLASRKARRSNPALDVVLVTHPREVDDVPRMFPWASRLSSEEIAEFLPCLRPIFGEVIETEHLNVGILFLPMLASEVLDPRQRKRCRALLERDAIDVAAAASARHICLGGLTGSLSQYGRRLTDRASTLNIEITTGHTVTALSIFKLYERAVQDLDLRASERALAVIGVGSVGGAALQLVTMCPEAVRPSSILLVDTAHQEQRLVDFAKRLHIESGIKITVEVLPSRERLPETSGCYAAKVIISAVSSPYILDIAKVSPDTLLIDDSQPYCWDRAAAWSRCFTESDIAPCDAGLVDARSVGYRSYFPFDFADDVGSGSNIAWSCLAEGLLRATFPKLPATIGEPPRTVLHQYSDAFEAIGFSIPRLQCGKQLLPVADLRRSFASSYDRPPRRDLTREAAKTNVAMPVYGS